MLDQVYSLDGPLCGLLNLKSQRPRGPSCPIQHLGKMGAADAKAFS